MSKLQQANDYVKQFKQDVIQTYRQNYHLMPEIGWMNDPNGFIYFKGEYHLFYQYYPYDSVWGPMHWGHAKSADLMNWEHLPIALAPDHPYDRDGCFSGSAIVKDDKLYVMYTGFILGENEEDIRQVQCIAYSKDGIHFEKVQENPVLTEMHLPEGAKPQDFRDPKVFEKDGKYYSVIVSKDEKEGGQVLLYTSQDLIKWEYVNTLAQSNNKQGIMWECPDLFPCDGQDILILSPMRIPEDGNKYWGINSTTYMIGRCNEVEGTYTYHTMSEIDYGLDFYAPQTTMDDKGRRIIIAWMQGWGRTMPNHIEGHKWAGTMTLPREVKIVDNKFYQLPLEEYKINRKNEMKETNVVVTEPIVLEGFKGMCYELELEVDVTESSRFGINVLKKGHQKTSVYFDRDKGLLTFDRSASGALIIGEEIVYRNHRQVEVALEDNKLRLQLFVDRSSVEVFINNGEYTMSSTVYPEDGSDEIELFAIGKANVISLKKWDLK